MTLVDFSEARPEPMVPLEAVAIDRLLAREPISHRSTALRHASIHDRPCLVGDDPLDPTWVVWLRPSDEGAWEAFADGKPEPALDWIESRVGRSMVAVLAPPSWEEPVRSRVGRVEAANIRTFVDFDLMMLPRFSPECRTLRIADAAAFEAITPPWALRSWGDFGSMLQRGLAVGLYSVAELISVAWTYESTANHDKIGVITVPRYRRLGLGRRVAGALIERVVNDRRKAPIWVTTASNLPSTELAKSLGFANPVAERLLRWTP
jgi:GNAT superfamily N-acetyltransferase